jgi:hypothetical protein
MDLHLNLKGVYFDAIKAGTKTREYRLASTWLRRLEGKTFDRVILKRGYPRSSDLERHLFRPWRGWELEMIQHPHFGNTAVVVCAIVVN